MQQVTQLQTEAWLLRGIYSIPGRMRFAGGRLSFTALGAGNCWPRHLRKLEADVGSLGLAERLAEGERVVVFDVPLTDVQEVRFPWYYFSGGVKLLVEGVRYRFGFSRPANTRLTGELVDVVEKTSSARRSGKAWKEVLLKAASADRS